jgi:hypothetical protein
MLDYIICPLHLALVMISLIACFSTKASERKELVDHVQYDTRRHDKVKVITKL